MRPMRLPLLSVNHRSLPYAVMPTGCAPAVTAYSVTTPSGVMRPILLAPYSVNHRLPSGPAAMPLGNAPALRVYSVTVCACTVPMLRLSAANATTARMHRIRKAARYCLIALSPLLVSPHPYFAKSWPDQSHASSEKLEVSKFLLIGSEYRPDHNLVKRGRSSPTAVPRPCVLALLLSLIHI